MENQPQQINNQNSNKSGVVKNLIIIVAIIGIFIYIIALFNSSPDISPQKPVVSENVSNKTAEPTKVTPTPQPKAISIGDEAYLRLPDNNDPEQVILLAINKDDYDEVLKTLMAKDYVGILDLSNQGKAFGVHNGSKVLVIDTAVGIRKVRIVKGVNPVDEDKVGLAGWVAMEWVKSE